MNETNDTLRRGIQAADTLRSAAHQLSASWTSHRMAIHRDLSLLAAIVLTGLILFIGPDDVLWLTAYYGAIVALLIVVIMAGLLLRATAAAEHRRLVACQESVARLTSAIRSYEVSPGADAESELAAAVANANGSVAPSTRGQVWSERLLFLLFILGLAGAFAGLMVDPANIHSGKEPTEDVMTTSYDSLTRL